MRLLTPSAAAAPAGSPREPGVPGGSADAEGVVRWFGRQHGGPAAIQHALRSFRGDGLVERRSTAELVWLRQTLDTVEGFPFDCVGTVVLVVPPRDAGRVEEVVALDGLAGRTLLMAHARLDPGRIEHPAARRFAVWRERFDEAVETFLISLPSPPIVLPCVLWYDGDDDPRGQTGVDPRGVAPRCEHLRAWWPPQEMARLQKLHRTSRRAFLELLLAILQHAALRGPLADPGCEAELEDRVACAIVRVM